MARKKTATPKTDERLETCQKNLSYRFKNIKLLQAALTHSSSADDRKNSNERLEFFGDSVLGLVVCEELFERLPDAQEGELTKIKSAVVSRKICAEVAEELNLPQALLLGQGLDPHEQLPKSLAAGVLEAVIGAIYLDGGLAAAKKFILRTMGDHLDESCESEHQFNFKSQLQQHAQRTLNATPHYEMLDEKGPDHSKCFEIAVSIGYKQFCSAWGPSKKEAEQKAARLALEELGVLMAECEPEESEA
ncbi:MAG: ribonuclease III [Phycisphaerae bacterium]